MQGKEQLWIHLLYESLVGQCEHTTQPEGSISCHVIDTKSAVSLLKFTNKFLFIFCIFYSHLGYQAVSEPQEWSYFESGMDNFIIFRLKKYNHLTGLILKSKDIGAIFQKKSKQKRQKNVKIGQNIRKFGQKCTKFEQVLKEIRWLLAIIARNKLLE